MNIVIGFAYVWFQSYFPISLPLVVPNLLKAFIANNNIVSNKFIGYECTHVEKLICERIGFNPFVMVLVTIL